MEEEVAGMEESRKKEVVPYGQTEAGRHWEDDNI